MALRQPLALTLDILELRAYAAAKDQVERSKLEDLRSTPMVQIVQENQYELHKRIMAQREAAQRVKANGIAS